MTLQKPILPTVPFSHFPPLDQYRPKQMFQKRIMNFYSQLVLPDAGGGDLNQEERERFLSQIVEHFSPLPALTVFQGVVALEDYIREVGNGLGAITGLNNIKGITNIEILSVGLKRNTPDEEWKSTEQTTPMLDPNKVNKRFVSSLSIEPLRKDDRLKDLIILRHIIAHHSSNLRKIDVDRFQYYHAEENHIFRPTTTFARETLNYLNEVVVDFQKTVLDRILKLLKNNITKKQFLDSCLVKEIVTLFEYPMAQENINEDNPLMLLTPEEELEKFKLGRDQQAVSSITNLSHSLYD